jgi:hypothetical protein
MALYNPLIPQKHPPGTWYLANETAPTPLDHVTIATTIGFRFCTSICSRRRVLTGHNTQVFYLVGTTYPVELLRSILPVVQVYDSSNVGMGSLYNIHIIYWLFKANVTSNRNIYTTA